MRLLLIIAIFFGLTASSNETEVVVGNKTTMEVEPVVYEAGDVIKGEMVTAKFTLTNTGDYPLVLGDVKGSCSCTVADYPDEPIAPGESGVVEARVNTDQLGVGPLNKAVRIVANTEPSVTQVVIHASVLRK